MRFLLFLLITSLAEARECSVMQDCSGDMCRSLVVCHDKNGLKKRIDYSSCTDDSIAFCLKN